MNKLLIFIKYIIRKKKWRKLNDHNYTNISKRFPKDMSIVNVGKMTYGTLNVQAYGNKKESLSIGSYCSIAGNVVFLLGGEHPYKGLSTYPFRKYVGGINENTATKGPIILEDDVWIGENCLILSGVRIGQGAIIAAGSIVTKNIPPYAIFGSNKILKYRFSKDIIDQLVKHNFSEIDEKFIKNNIEKIYEELTLDNITEKLKVLNNNS